MSELIRLYKLFSGPGKRVGIVFTRQISYINLSPSTIAVDTFGGCENRFPERDK
jgi:hypothetical protein